ncbi:MAG TPA: thiamine diphosphokinase [Acidimicrobiales bacterium]
MAVSPPLVVVVTGGDPPDPELVDALGLPPDGERIVVAADSGVAHAVGLGLRIDVAVGDFDSVDPALLATVEAEGSRVERYPVAKDATDLELALDTAVGLGAGRVVVLGGHGGRLDHFLANALVLAASKYDAVELEALVGSAVVTVVRPGPGIRFSGRPGQLVTILPVHGAAEGVRTEGLRFALHGETLIAGSTRGVSNELAATEAAVALTGGAVLVVRPEFDRT